jgi:hypothetical protein
VRSGMSAARQAWRRLAGWWQRQETAPPPSPWLARQVRDNTRLAKATEVRVAALKAQLDAQQAQLDSLAGGMVRAFGATGSPLPESLAADSPTQPLPLRRVV